MAAPHKKKLLFLSFLEEQKRKEVHVQCSLEGAIWWREAENRKKKNWEMERRSEKGMTLCISGKHPPLLRFVYSYLETPTKLLS